MLAGAVRIEVLCLHVQMLDIEDQSQLDCDLLEAFLPGFLASMSWQQQGTDIAFAQIEREPIVCSGC